MQILKGQKSYLDIILSYHLLPTLGDFYVGSVYNVTAKALFDFPVIFPEI